MKKTIQLSIVLLVSLNLNAEMILSGPSYILPGEPFQIIVSGLSSDITFQAGGGTQVGVYATTYEGEFANTPEGSWWLNGVDGFVTQAAGNLAHIAGYDPYYYGGFEILIGDTEAGGVQDGEWAVLHYLAEENEPYTTINFNLVHYDTSYEVPVHSISLNILPEPTTLLLLGMGGVLMRKRK